MILPNTRLAASAFAVSLALSGAAVATASAADLPAYPFVHVTGSAFQAALPDIGSLDFEIVATDADPAAARAVLEARMGELHALMRQVGLDPEDAQAREVRQSVRKGEQGAAGEPLYEIRCDVHVNVRNLTVWPALAGGLLGKPNLDSFAASFGLSTMDQLNDELVTEAIRDARRRADVMAAAAGRRVGAVMGATPDQLKNLTTAMGLERGDFRETARRADGGRASQTDREQLLVIPALRLRQPVDVVFRLENLPAARAARK
ncbi:SIMPL domain-containing protein [Massilia sp. TN1-12]|uniref:SIMPL domain-containing protein n=1 Tax=Massilia paldalensis TaxID=3377675 RepID=UPI0038515A06